MGGYRYQQLEDHLAVDDSLTFSGTQSAFPAGSIVEQSDRFDTRNVFQGGEVGHVGLAPSPVPGPSTPC